jgi:hypothetical protein
MAMAARGSLLDRHWPSFKALRSDYRARRLVLGIDRTFAQKWAILGQKGCPLPLQIACIVLVLIALAALAGASYTGWMGFYLMSVVQFIVAFLSARLVMYLAVAVARRTVIRDETLFRKWFHERRLSMFIKTSGEYVWNDTPDA